MKFMMLMFLSLSINFAVAQEEMTEDQEIDSITLEAPESMIEESETLNTEQELSLSSEDDSNIKNSEVIEPSKEAEVVPKDTATTTEVKPVAETTTEVKAVTATTTETDSEELGQVSGTQKYKITCTLNDDVREITAINQADGTVGIEYTKFGQKRTIALSKSDYADQVAEKIKNNLANGKYPYACTQE